MNVTAGQVVDRARRVGEVRFRDELVSAVRAAAARISEALGMDGPP